MTPRCSNVLTGQAGDMIYDSNSGDVLFPTMVAHGEARHSNLVP